MFLDEVAEEARGPLRIRGEEFARRCERSRQAGVSGAAPLQDLAEPMSSSGCDRGTNSRHVGIIVPYAVTLRKTSPEVEPGAEWPLVNVPQRGAS